MKFFQKTVFLFFVLSIYSHVFAFEKCIKTDVPSIDLETLDAGTGSISFDSVEICTSLSSSLKVEDITGEGRVIYHSFAPSNRDNVTFVADGGHDLVYFTDKEIMRLTYSGGPVNYMVDGNIYEVLYQNLIFTLNLSGEVLETTGGVTINGQYFDGSSLPYEYFKIF